MKILRFKMFEATTSLDKKDLTWLKSFIDEQKSDKHEYKLETKNGKDGKYLLLSNSKHQIELYDNEQDNNFFYMRIKEGNKILQDFKKSKSKKEGMSPDEIASEVILTTIAKYFQKA